MRTDPDLLERVRAWMEAQRMLEDTDTLLCALSGGADSVCLLHLLLRLSGELGFRLEAAHYHHGIRGAEADRDRDFAAALCRDLSIPLHQGRGDVPAYAAAKGMGLEEAARELRYAFLRETAKSLGRCRIATAHQAEDNAETLLLNLCRGAGLRGLCGIPPVREGIIRPLLPAAREEILEYLAEHGLPHVEDSTNALEEGDRNLLRHRVLPVLRELNPEFPRAALAASQLLRQDEEYLCSLAEELAGETSQSSALRGKPDAASPERGGGPGSAGEVRFSCGRLLSAPEPVASRALRLGAERLEIRLEQKHVAALLELAAGTGGLARLDLPGGLRASREFDLLRLRRGGNDWEPYDILLEPGVWQTVPATGQRVCRVSAGDAANVHEKFQIFRFKNSNICGSIHVRPRKIGDTLRIAGRIGEKTLKKWMIEERIPALERDSWPVFADDLGVVAVPGLGTAERAAAGDGEADGAILLSERNEPCRK